MTGRCSEYFGCKRQEECPYYNYKGPERCWEVDRSLTPFVPDDFEEKMIYCENCLYYKHVHKTLERE